MLLPQIPPVESFVIVIVEPKQTVLLPAIVATTGKSATIIALVKVSEEHPFAFVI